MVVFMESDGVLTRAILYSALALKNNADNKNWQFVGKLESLEGCQELVTKSKDSVVFVCDSPVRLVSSPEEVSDVCKLIEAKDALIIEIPDIEGAKITGLIKEAKSLKIPVMSLPRKKRTEGMNEIQHASARLLSFLEKFNF